SPPSYNTSSSCKYLVVLQPASQKGKVRKNKYIYVFLIFILKSMFVFVTINRVESSDILLRILLRTVIFSGVRFYHLRFSFFALLLSPSLISRIISQAVANDVSYTVSINGVCFHALYIKSSSKAPGICIVVILQSF